MDSTMKAMLPPRPTLATVLAHVGTLRIEDRLCHHAFDIAFGSRNPRPSDVRAKAAKRLASEYEDAVRMTLRTAQRAEFAWTASQRKAMAVQILNAPLDQSTFRAMVQRSFIRRTNDVALRIHQKCFKHIEWITNVDPRIAHGAFVESILIHGMDLSDRDYGLVSRAIIACTRAAEALLGPHEPAS